jgi:hypothetical protein
MDTDNPTVPQEARICGSEEEVEIETLNAWVEEQGLPRGIVSFDFADPDSGEQRAVFDLAWPNRFQEELSQPVALLINEDVKTLSMAGEAGFRCFAGIQALKRYVTQEVLGEAKAA